jgi:hypothetical protein
METILMENPRVNADLEIHFQTVTWSLTEMSSDDGRKGEYWSIIRGSQAVRTSDSEKDGYPTDDSGALTDKVDDGTERSELWSIRRVIQEILQQWDIVKNVTDLSQQLDRLGQVVGPHADVCSPRICQLLREILKLDKIPREDELQVRKRTLELYGKVTTIATLQGPRWIPLSTSTETGARVENLAPAPAAEETKDAKEVREGRSSPTKSKEPINPYTVSFPM